METLTAPKPSDLVPPVILLDATHRCDACQAQAYVRTVTYDGILEWCGHHYAQYADGLMIHTVETVDERWRLEKVAKLDVSA